VLTIKNKKIDAFSEIDLKTIENIALFISIAIDNANAYEIINFKERQLSTIFETANEGIALVDKKGNFTFVNKSLTRITGYSQNELLNLNYFNLLFDENEINRNNFENLVKGKIEVIAAENKYLRKDGTNIWGKISARCIKKENGEIDKVVGIFTDIEELKQSEFATKLANEKITASISYASRIQKAILPRTEILSALFPENFIIFMPREIVSGDFYYIKQVNNFLIIAAADCTGHGVPGAFMSVLGVALLNEIVRKKDVTTAAEVLNQLREYVKIALKQTGDSGEQKDGMDIALCVLNLENFEIQFAGAFNPLWLVKLNKESGQNDIIEYKADKMPIGIYPKEKPFSQHEFQLQAGDQFYIFSDGYASQSGCGEKGNKLKSKEMQKIILRHSHETMQQQAISLVKEFELWRGTMEQVDDVLVIGVKI